VLGVGVVLLSLTGVWIWLRKRRLGRSGAAFFRESPGRVLL
jgi:uncharacterized iron-regulated membrane protein